MSGGLGKDDMVMIKHYGLEGPSPIAGHPHPCTDPVPSRDGAASGERGQAAGAWRRMPRAAPPAGASAAPEPPASSVVRDGAPSAARWGL